MPTSNMGTGRRFSSLFSSLSPPSPTSSSSPTTSLSSTSSLSSSTTTATTTTTLAAPSLSSISSDDHHQFSMPSSSTSTLIRSRPRRLSSSSSSSSSSTSTPSSSSPSSSSLLLQSSSSSSSLSSISSLFSSSSSSSWWLWSAMLVVVLLLSTHPGPTSAMDPVGVARAGGGAAVGVDARLGRGGGGNSRLSVRSSLDKKKSILKAPIDSNGAAIRAAVKKEGEQSRQSNFKEQTLHGSLKKDSLLKQLQDHEDENNQKQKDMNTREQKRHQRQEQQKQLLAEQLQQQQQQADKTRREKQQQREQEQKWLVDMQKKVAVKARQKQLLSQSQADPVVPVVPDANQNNINSNVNNNNNNNINIVQKPAANQNANSLNNNKDIPILGAIPTPAPFVQHGVGGGLVTPKPVVAVADDDDVIGGGGAFKLEQNQHQAAAVDPPVIEAVAVNKNNANRLGVGVVDNNNNNNDNNEFPRLSNRKHNKINDNNNNDNNDDDWNVNHLVKDVHGNDNNNNDNDDNNNHQQAVNNNDIDNMDVNVNSANNRNLNNNNNNDDNGNGGLGGAGQAYNVNNRMNNNGNNNDFINNNFNNNNNPPPRADIPSVGGININWDWEDFSIMFDNYGGAEMKVRRAPHATTGEPWPMPQYYSKKENKVYKVSRELRFVPTGHTCDILDEAMARHLQRVLRGSVEDMYDNLQHAEGTNIKDPSLKYESDAFVKAATISRVELRVRKACTKYPSLESDESYDLVVKKKRTFIYANEIWGVLRGLETLGQLVWRGTDGILYIKETVVSDYPRFPHRGLHIDTCRHYLFKEVLLDIMDSMEMNKMNVFHWHMTDDQSFPYESRVYPELSRNGAYHPTYVYSLEDIAELIEYARMRGIRVIPEFDTPGHTYAWGLSRPELLTQCYSGSTPVKGYLGPLDPSKNSTYRFLSTLFTEVMDVFKDQFMHLGGDEVPLGCWQSNPEVMSFANELNRKHQEMMAKQPSNAQQQQQQQNYNNYGGSWSMWSDEIKRVYEYYETRLIKLLNDIGHKRKVGVRYIMWQEVINNNLQLPNDTIIQVWMGDMGDVMRVTSLGYNVLYSTCWYLDHVEYGTKWPKYYHCDPVDQSYGYHIDEKKVLGGEAAFWSEYFTNENLIPMMWPRASAVAERLWSNREVKNLDQAAVRLSEHRCRMIKRGINAGEINGPGYCLHTPPKRRLFNDTIGCKGGNCSRLHNFVEIEDIQVHVSQRGGGLAECGNVFSRGDTGILVALTLICLLVLFMVKVTRSSSRLGRMRHCKNRSILLVFVCLLMVYFLCYTTIGLRAFEFSGSIHKTFQEDKRGQGKDGLDGFQDQKRLMS